MKTAIAVLREFVLDFWPMLAMDAVFLLALLWLLGAFNCRQARAEGWQPPRAPEIVAMAGVEALVAVDVLQTLDMNRHPERHYFEANPFLGYHPTDTRIVLAGVGGGLFAAGLFVALPARVRWLVPLVLGALEVAAVAGNATAGLSFGWAL